MDAKASDMADANCLECSFHNVVVMLRKGVLRCRKKEKIASMKANGKAESQGESNVICLNE